MRILHIVEGLGRSSGVATFIENIVREQRALGHTVEVLTNANVHTSTFLTPTFNFDVVHIHGLWSMLLHRAMQYARHRNIPVVWSTHGMTAPWSLHHKWWKKCLPWYLYQRPDLKRTTLIHCTTDLEADWNHALGLTNTFIAPLGATLPKSNNQTIKRSNNSTVRLGSSPSPKTLLYVGRIYPVKALDNLIRAYVLATNHQPLSTNHWNLRIVGPDQAGHMAELMSLCDQLHLPYTIPENSTSSTLLLGQNSLDPKSAESAKSVVQFVGPRFDQELDAEYENCTALALVSHTENFGATVVDALAHAKPVITSTKTPWKIVADKHCGWWCSNEPENLSKALLELFSTSISDLNLLGQNGRALVEQQYTWPAIARNLIEHYQSLTTNH